jgi:hypothetical protein
LRLVERTNRVGRIDRLLQTGKVTCARACACPRYPCDLATQTTSTSTQRTMETNNGSVGCWIFVSRLYVGNEQDCIRLAAVVLGWEGWNDDGLPAKHANLDSPPRRRNSTVQRLTK